MITGIIIGLVVLVILIVVHELGHAIAARRNGVGVEEFGIGFPPKAWSKKLKNGILLSINWLPLGGFVKLQGENDEANQEGDYGSATFWQKTKILFAGVLINWLVAVLILTGLAFVGLPKIFDHQFSVPNDTQIVVKPVFISSTVEGYPAESAGLEPGDVLISFADEPVGSVEQLVNTSLEHKGEAVTVVYERDGEQNQKTLTLRDADESVFGATLAQQQAIKATWSAPIVGVVTTAQFTWETLKGIGQLLSDIASGLVLQLSNDEATKQAASERLGRVGDSVAGPIGILAVIFPAAEQAGIIQLLFLTAVISLTLAVMNALPIPALDGGRWFVTAIFKLFRQKLTREKEEYIQGVGFIVLILLIILVTVSDVAKLFN